VGLCLETMKALYSNNSMVTTVRLNIKYTCHYESDASIALTISFSKTRCKAVADFGLASGKEFLAGLLDKIKVPNHVVRGMIARAHVLLIL
jgi:hypothetical protein